MKTATLITTKTIRTDVTSADQGVYKLNPPATWKDYATGLERETEHVLVSAADVLHFGPETYIFPCDEDGNVASWGELEGSIRGVLDHTAALAGAGYKIVEEDQ